MDYPLLVQKFNAFGDMSDDLNDVSDFEIKVFGHKRCHERLFGQFLHKNHVSFLPVHEVVDKYSHHFRLVACLQSLDLSLALASDVIGCIVRDNFHEEQLVGHSVSHSLAIEDSVHHF